jgi:hypothetical protein
MLRDEESQEEPLKKYEEVYKVKKEYGVFQDERTNNI